MFIIYFFNSSIEPESQTVLALVPLCAQSGASEFGAEQTRGDKQWSRDALRVPASDPLAIRLLRACRAKRRAAGQSERECEQQIGGAAHAQADEQAQCGHRATRPLH